MPAMESVSSVSSVTCDIFSVVVVEFISVPVISDDEHDCADTENPVSRTVRAEMVKKIAKICLFLKNASSIFLIFIFPPNLYDISNTSN